MADRAKTRISEFFGKRYLWLINHQGNLELHPLGSRADTDAKRDDVE